MKPPGEAELAALGDRLGHRFATPALLRQALTHPSAQPGARIRLPSYQRFEFLGDRVLGLAVAAMLFEAFPAEDEGVLARRQNLLVSADACAEVAEALGLGGAVLLGSGEHASGGRHKTAILGDVAEAVIGAIFLDAGYGAAEAFVRRNWQARMLQPAGDLRDAKTALQEWAHARGLENPSYDVLDRSGPAHQPHFVVTVDVQGLGRVEGTGRSKRIAEQEAAARMLREHGARQEAPHG